MNRDKDKIQELLNKHETGIVIDGPNPWDPQIHNQEIYSRILSGGSLALGESYMDGWWEAEDLVEFFNKLLSKRIDTKIVGLSLIWLFFKSKLGTRLAN